MYSSTTVRSSNCRMPRGRHALKSWRVLSAADSRVLRVFGAESGSGAGREREQRRIVLQQCILICGNSRERRCLTWRKHGARISESAHRRLKAVSPKRMHDRPTTLTTNGRLARHTPRYSFRAKPTPCRRSRAQWRQDTGCAGARQAAAALQCHRQPGAPAPRLSCPVSA